MCCYVNSTKLNNNFKYSKISVFKKALAELTKQIGSTVIDRSTLYSGFNDLNEYLTHQSFTAKLNDYENRQSSINS